MLHVHLNFCNVSCFSIPAELRVHRSPESIRSKNDQSFGLSVARMGIFKLWLRYPLSTKALLSWRAQSAIEVREIVLQGVAEG